MALEELSSVPAVLRFPVGLVAAPIALFVMDRIMKRIPEGTTPPAVAASVLTGRTVDDAPPRLASVAHYLAGLGTALIFVYFLLVVEWLIGGSSLATVSAATLVLYVLMVGFFVAVPLPRAVGPEKPRRSAIGRGWAVAAAGYLAVLAPVSVGFTLVLA